MKSETFEIIYTMVNSGYERVFATYDQFDLAKKRFEEMINDKAYCRVTLVKTTREELTKHDRAITSVNVALCEKCKYPTDYHYMGACPQ